MQIYGPCFQTISLSYDYDTSNDLNILITQVVWEKKLHILGFAKSFDSINRNESIDSPNNELMNRKLRKYTNRFWSRSIIT